VRWRKKDRLIIKKGRKGEGDKSKREIKKEK
jgi:hypothetical protein